MSTPRPWPENAWPTREQLAAWLTVCTSAERLEVCGRYLDNAQAVNRCIVWNHESAVEMIPVLGQQVSALTAERDVARDALRRQSKRLTKMRRWGRYANNLAMYRRWKIQQLEARLSTAADASLPSRDYSSRISGEVPPCEEPDGPDMTGELLGFERAGDPPSRNDKPCLDCNGVGSGCCCDKETT